MTLDFGVVWARWPELLMGLGGTLFLALSGMILALIIGVLGVAIRRSGSRIGSALVIAFVELIRNTPFLVQIFFIFFALPLAGVRLNPTVTAIIALGLNGGAYAIEIIRGGVESIPRGQTEAGLALGLRPADDGGRCTRRTSRPRNPPHAPPQQHRDRQTPETRDSTG